MIEEDEANEIKEGGGGGDGEMMDRGVWITVGDRSNAVTRLKQSDGKETPPARVSVLSRKVAPASSQDEETMDSLGELPGTSQWRGGGGTTNHHAVNREEESAGMSVGELNAGGVREMPSGLGPRFDTFLKDDGTSVTVYFEMDQMFGIDWENQEEWLKTGRFLNETLPDPTKDPSPPTPHPIPNPSTESHHTAPDPYLIQTASDPRTLTFMDSRYRKITTHLFPTLRPVRYALSPDTLRWEPMSLSWELEIPEIAAMVDLIEDQVNGKKRGPATAPTRGEFPVLEEEGGEKRDREREMILLALRERGYDVALAIKDVEARRLGAAASLDAVAERFFKETEEASASAARALGVSGGTHLGATHTSPPALSKTYRAPIYKAWEDQVTSLKDRVALLEFALQEKDKCLQETHARSRQKDVELKRLERTQSSIQSERERFHASLVASSTHLDTANERAERLEAELEVLRRGDVGRRHDGLLDLVREKEEHVLRMRFVIGALQQRIEKIGEERRKERRVLREVLAEVRRLKNDHNHLQTTTRQTLHLLPLIPARLLEPLQSRLKTLTTDLAHHRTLHQACRHASHLLRQSLISGPHVTVMCRVRPDDRVRFAGKSPVTVVGGREVGVAAVGRRGKESVGRVPRFFGVDKAFGSTAGQRDLFGEIDPHISPVLDGCNLCIIAYGQTGSGKTFTLQGTPASPGLTILTIQRLFQLSRERPDEKYTFSAACLEIYNENVYDLFSNPDTPLTLDGHGGMKLHPTPTEPTFPTSDTLISHVSRALAHRTLTNLTLQTRRTFTQTPHMTTSTTSIPHQTVPQGQTTSTGGVSRSHIILSVGVRNHSSSGGVELSRVTFVDLAGAEAAFEVGDGAGGRRKGGWGESQEIREDAGVGGGRVGMVNGGVTGMRSKKLLESASADRSFVSLKTLLRGLSFGVPFTPPPPPPTPPNDTKEGGESSPSNKFTHVDSALARVLSGLDGTAGGISGPRSTGFGATSGKTFLILHISPLDDHVHETTRSLAFGSAVRGGMTVV
ncbi:hypothetical protein HDU67_009484 [Dinochytrium kinnereticum]|nr:hypothetical protein HDU67_009484 [Dinochytrium kinnereticum]